MSTQPDSPDVLKALFADRPTLWHADQKQAIREFQLRIAALCESSLSIDEYADRVEDAAADLGIPREWMRENVHGGGLRNAGMAWRLPRLRDVLGLVAIMAAVVLGDWLLLWGAWRLAAAVCAALARLL